MCVYESGVLVDILQKKKEGNMCSLKLFGKDNKDEGSYSIEFTKIKWIKPITKQTFILTISTPLNFKVKDISVS